MEFGRIHCRIQLRRVQLRGVRDQGHPQGDALVLVRGADGAENLAQLVDLGAALRRLERMRENDVAGLVDSLDRLDRRRGFGGRKRVLGSRSRLQRLRKAMPSRSIAQRLMRLCASWSLRPRSGRRRGCGQGRGHGGGRRGGHRRG